MNLNWLDIDLLHFQYFILMLARVGTMVSTIPVLGSGSAPAPAKVGLTFFLCLIVYPFVARAFPVLPPDFLPLAALIVREVMVGLLMGLISSALFAAFQLSGQIFGMQIGFGIVNVFDPLSELQVSILGQFTFLVAVLLFLAMDGHHLFIWAAAHSYDYVPLGGFSISKGLGEEAVNVLRSIFTLAFKIGLPVIASLFLLTMAMGLVARTVPQMNVFIVGLPLNIMVGLFILLSTISLLPWIEKGHLYDTMEAVTRALKMAGGTL